MNPYGLLPLRFFFTALKVGVPRAAFFASLTAILFLLPVLCFAEDYGKTVYCMVHSAAVGNLGLILGLFIALAGLKTLLFGSTSGGFMMMAVGVCITVAPAFLQSFLEGSAAFYTGDSSQVSAQSATAACGANGAPTPAADNAAAWPIDEGNGRTSMVETTSGQGAAAAPAAQP